MPPGLIPTHDSVDVLYRQQSLDERLHDSWSACFICRAVTAGKLYAGPRLGGDILGLTHRSQFPYYCQSIPMQTEIPVKPLLAHFSLSFLFLPCPGIIVDPPPVLHHPTL
ncbi:unnamed protein product [Kuraishia capsulata CBS 1993]|uniref:Uncharacterized protein n=1 Tax=Kuraishia capsulata CBS 1993 TaxID=1382522 RepID=W6MY14_9ASCO|nr:uncharacterized protein KUCA_T00005834001 [Kuraishia capsulata CBS 1993]CDK29840.1 unnamed protein product [Kuraishia capsulata CBS 1993]